MVESNFNFKGKFIAVLGPSGSGKSTYISKLIEKYPEIKFGVSATTRPPREGEIDKIDYHFLSVEEFKKKIDKGEFIEYAFVHYKFYYGLLKETILESLKSKNIIIKDIEYKGYLQLKKILPKENLVSIFILPPSIDKIIERIKKRASITKEEIDNRILYMQEELKIKDQYDYIFEPIDEDIEKSFKNFEKIYLNLF